MQMRRLGPHLGWGAVTLAMLTTPAAATDVVWLEPPSAEQRARVSTMLGFSGELTLLELRAAPTDLTAAEDVHYRALEQSLVAVRAYETKLDGELIIMDDLQGPLEQITIVRDGDDRESLFKALAYQGFAVNRFFDTTLATDPKAEVWRANLGETIVEQPWRDAVAVAPKRDITTYDVAEAPQRVAFSAVKTASASALPGGIRIKGLPAESTLFVDGEAREASGQTLRLPPGRHWVHIAKEGHVLARWDLVLEPGTNQTIEPPISDETWQAFITAATTAKAIPEPVRKNLDAVGGEVWFARPGDDDPQVWSVTPRGVTPVELPKVDKVRKESDGGISIAGAIGGGWLSSGDFYTQAFDVAPNERSTVNSVVIVPSITAAYDLGLFRFGGGVDAPFTPGEFHVAQSGDTAYRLRPHPHLAIGTPYAVATFGWTLPYHPTVGVRAMLPLPGGLEVRGDARIGLGGEFTRSDGSTYTTLPLYTAFMSVGWRWRP